MDYRPRLNEKSNDNPLQSLLWKSYDQILQQLESGCPENVISYIRELRFKGEADDTSETLRRLISIRIAIKGSTISDDGTCLLQKESSVPWINGEIEFVVGLVKFHQGLFAEGSMHFKKAENIFASVDFEARSILSAFNCMIGEFYSGYISDINAKLDCLRILEKRARASLDINRPDQSRLRKVLAMTLREKAVLFEKEERFHAAIEELDKAIDIFALEGTRSDYHLALIQASDLKLAVGDRTGALRYYEYVVKPVDTRVEFPLAYIEWRLFGKHLNEKSFTVVPPTWLERWRQSKDKSDVISTEFQKRILKWLVDKNELVEQNSGRSWKLKVSSLEGKLLRLLTKTRASKLLLSEMLWPEFAKANEIDHRLHQLVSRTNQKYGGIILYDGSAYKLSCSIEVE